MPSIREESGKGCTNQKTKNGHPLPWVAYFDPLTLLTKNLAGYRLSRGSVAKTKLFRQQCSQPKSATRAVRMVKDERVSPGEHHTKVITWVVALMLLGWWKPTSSTIASAGVTAGFATGRNILCRSMLP